MAKNDFCENKALYWEVVAPEPFIIDKSITDEKFISEMVSVSKTSEITELIQSFLQKPTKTFILFCSTNELKNIFNVSYDNCNIKIERQKNGWLIAVTDKCNEIIGRGEIILIGDKFNKKNVLKFMKNHMSEFLDKYKIGNERIKSLMYKMEIIKTKFNSNANVLS